MVELCENRVNQYKNPNKHEGRKYGFSVFDILAKTKKNHAISSVFSVVFCCAVIHLCSRKVVNIVEHTWEKKKPSVSCLAWKKSHTTVHKSLFWKWFVPSLSEKAGECFLSELSRLWIANKD